MLNSTKLDLVSITFEQEIRLQLLQAISIEKHFEIDNINKYMIVLNGSSNQELAEYLEDLFNLFELSRSLQRKIQFINANDLLDWIPPETENRSYLLQQIIKLKIARLVNSKHYLLLDSKNHFIRDVNIDDFISNEKIKTQFKKPAYGLIKFLNHSLSVFNLRNEDYIENAMPTITPYLMKTLYVRELTTFLEEKFSKPFEQVFFEEIPNATEFYLYYSWLIKNNLLEDYVQSAGNGVTLYTRYPEDHDLCKELLRKAQSNKLIKVFGLHRNRIPKLDEGELQILKSIWQNANLLDKINPDYIFNRITNESSISR